MSHRLPPTSNDQRRGRASHTISDAPRTPPPPPDGLTASEQEAWRGFWASPVSVLWTSDDAPAVVRLIRLRARIDAEGVMSCPVSLFSQVGQLRTARLEPAGAAPGGDRGGRGRRQRTGRRLPNSRERERLLRG